MVEANKKFHKGVKPTRPFDGVMFLNRKFMRETYEKAIRAAMRGKKI